MSSQDKEQDLVAIEINNLVRPLSLFFFYGLLNEDKAIHLTVRVVEYLKKQSVGQNLRVIMVKKAKDLFLSEWNKKTIKTKNAADFWIFPKGLDLGSWREFLFKASCDEVVSLLMAHVLKIDETVITEGLQISYGTHRFRTMNALKILGSGTYLLK